MSNRWTKFREDLTDDLRHQTDQTLTIILVGAGIVFILIGLFSHNLWFKGAAAAYAILP